MKEQILEILEGLKPGVSFETQKGLVTDKIIDSITMMELITLLEETFDISIGMEYMDGKHFDSVDSMMEMIEELR
ncbi:MAG: acyl carrier protein [Lachnospiraceae bacterium]|nr:acyl carrier protein [Lachnospiraceae bacterium]